MITHTDALLTEQRAFIVLKNCAMAWLSISRKYNANHSAFFNLKEDYMDQSADDLKEINLLRELVKVQDEKIKILETQVAWLKAQKESHL
jgi:hypothetical protein